MRAKTTTAKKTGGGENTTEVEGRTATTTSTEQPGAQWDSDVEFPRNTTVVPIVPATRNSLRAGERATAAGAHPEHTDLGTIQRLEEIHLKSGATSGYLLERERDQADRSSVECYNRCLTSLNYLLLTAIQDQVPVPSARIEDDPNSSPGMDGLVRDWNAVVGQLMVQLDIRGQFSGQSDRRFDTTDMVASLHAMKESICDNEFSRNHPGVSEALEFALHLVPAFDEIGQLLDNRDIAHREEQCLTNAADCMNHCRSGLEACNTDGSMAARFAELLHEVHNEVNQIRIHQSHVKVLADTSLLTADGLTRTMLHINPPDFMAQRQVELGWGEERVADLVVIGAGPGGIAAGYHAGEMGLRAVVFEAGYAGQAFSDARAASVHEMRTSARTSSLFPAGVVPQEAVEKVGMPAMFAAHNIREISQHGRKTYEAATGRRFRTRFPQDADPNNLDLAATRGELFAHIAQAAFEVAEQETVFFSEQAPVNGVKKRDDGLWEIRTAAGHTQLARFILPANGFVGAEGQYARMIPEVEQLKEEHPDSYLVLRNKRDLIADGSTLAERIEQIDNANVDEGVQKRQPIISETLIGEPSVRAYLSQLEEGTTVAIVGSGESAAKGALEILSANPDLHVVLFTKSPLEPAQTQFPAENIGPQNIKEKMFESAAAEKAFKTLTQFGTPITPLTMQNVLEEVIEGNLTVLELGERFSADVLELDTITNENGETSTRVSIKFEGELEDNEIVQNLRRQEAQYVTRGIIDRDTRLVREDDPVLAEIDGPLFIAAGYDRKGLHREDRIMKDLREAGSIQLAATDEKAHGEVLLDPKNRLASAADPTVLPVGALNQGAPVDSAIMGITSRAYFAVRYIRVSLAGTARGDELVSEGYEMPEADTELPQTSAGVQSVSEHTGSILEQRALAFAQERFPGNPMLIELRRRQLLQQPLTPAEELIMDRATDLFNRLA